MVVNSNVWTRKLEQVGALDCDDKLLLDTLATPSWRYRAEQDVIRAGDTPTHVDVLLKR